MPSWSVERQTRARRERESVLFSKKKAASLRVCLLYPNRYAVAMSNLGFQAVYEIIDRHPGVVCERAFLPDEYAVGTGPSDVRSFESFAPLRDFDVLAFSISFETDYWHVVRLLQLAGVTLWSHRRGDDEPLVVAGGPAIFLNPEPLADFVDLFLIGEAEEMLPEFLDRLCETHSNSRLPRSEFLWQCAEVIGGAYVPALYEPEYAGPVLRALHYRGPGTPRVERRLIWDLDRFATTSRVLAPEAVFGDMVLVEASRGCQWGCRFCAAGYMYRPIRTRSVQSLEQSLREGLQHRRTIGLVGAEMASVPGVERLAAIASEAGGRLSPSSLKADCVTPGLAAAVGRGRNRSVTVAPEAGSERMRRVINKNLSEADILRAADLLVGEGVNDLKLYFMVGLPGEQWDDVLAIADLARKIRACVGAAEKARGRVACITVSVNPFVPKPWTPFQWEPMEEIATLRRKLSGLRTALAKVPNLYLDAQSPREAYFQTLMSRGDRRVGLVVRAIHDADGDWWAVIRAWQRDSFEGLPHPDEYVHRRYDDDELLPWDFIDHRITKSFLRIERRKALLERQTPPCDTATCTACAAC